MDDLRERLNDAVSMVLVWILIAGLAWVVLLAIVWLIGTVAVPSSGWRCYACT